MTSYVCFMIQHISMSTEHISSAQRAYLANDYHAGHTKYQEIRLYWITEINEICNFCFHIQYSEPQEEMQMPQMFIEWSPKAL